MASTPDPGAANRSDDLVAALLEIERHVAAGGWDQPPRLFALVSTDRLIAAEPGLADRLRRPTDDLADVLATQLADDLGATAERADRYTAVEQEHFSSTGDLIGDLTQISWPESVDGCALAVERTFLPAGTEVELPDDPQEAAGVVAAHPDRQEVRVVVGVDRRRTGHGLARVRSHPNELLGGAELVPGLVEVLAHTLT